MLSIEYHFNNKGFRIFCLKAEEERCSKFAKRSRSVVIYQKMLNSAVFQNSVTPRWNSQSETFCLPLNPYIKVDDNIVSLKKYCTTIGIWDKKADFRI